MAIDREKLLQSAAKYAEKKKYDKAIADYRKIVQTDPSDARTMLKIGDLQSKMLDFRGAIETYNRVATGYAGDGFFLKAIAVYKQIRELIRKHAPELAAQYSHVTPRLAEIYAQLNLISDALTAYDEVATLYQKSGRDREAIEVFRKTVQLDPMNPLPHLRLAEACCKVQEVDAAIDSFWTAAELLLGLKRPDDALKVIERILHFRQDPKYARAAAELLLKRNDPQAGMLALSRLQIAFQAAPKDLDTLALLAQAFEVINQPDKSLAVHIEMGRLARDQRRGDLWAEIIAHLQQSAPTNPDVLALIKAGPPDRSSVAKLPPAADPLPARKTKSAPPAPMMDRHSAPEVVVHAEEEVFDLDQDVEYLDDDDQTDVHTSPSVRPGESETDGDEDLPEDEYAQEGVAVDGSSVVVEEAGSPGSFQPSAHAHKAIVDAESFRRLGLLDKAVEALHIALEIDPNSVPIREKLREILVDAGEREPAIQETLNIAIIHLHNQAPDLAEPLALEVLEIEPGHADAQNILAHAQAMREAEAMHPVDGHLESYDVESMRASQALGDIVPPAPPLPSFDLDEEPSAAGRAAEAEAPRSRRAGPHSERPGRPSADAIEEVLEEADFFAAQGLYSDAEAILSDILKHAPGHILLKERLAEVRAAHAASGQLDEAPPHIETPDDNAFDIAASLDALDELDAPQQPQMADPTQEVNVDEVFAKFKEGVKATVAESDAATHYDLGLAYKEMGLLPDAIGEFDLASRDPSRALMCFAMIGMIESQLGKWAEAEAAYVKALESEGKKPEQDLSLRYDLALVSEHRGDVKTCLVRLIAIAKTDPAYRDVAARIRALGGQMPSSSDSEDDDFDAAFDNLMG